MTDGWSLAVAPLIPWPALAALAVGAVAVGVVYVRAGARGAALRACAMAALLAGLANPIVNVERRDPLPDVAVFLRDVSPSMSIDDRAARADAALAALTAAAEAAGVETRVVDFGDGDQDGTRFAADFAAALADAPPDQRAGVVAVTDGRWHDAPDALDALPGAAPIHSVIVGRRGEVDRRLTILSAPAFQIVGGEAEVVLRVDDLDGASGAPARVTIRQAGRPARSLSLRVGEAETLRIPIDRAGPSVVGFAAEPAAGELSTRNNAAAATIAGVRDRLRVLLVSGEPHAGERAWRNLLKSDPSVDLVHFTILRPPEKQDGTPINELSLIAFPTRELFETKLSEFDLIIFDRFRRRGVLPRTYLDNVARYVEEGGALLKAVGPDYASPLSLHRTPLGRVLPAAPTGRIFEEPFRAAVTDVGRRHPVTAGLASDGEPTWGRWFRQIDAAPTSGDTLMAGVAGRPLLVLDRVRDGRVAHLLTDQIWLWARGFEGGGPQGELLRRTAHWLMREPDLEEESLTARGDGDRLVVTRRSLADHPDVVTAVGPDGARAEIALEIRGDGRAIGRSDAVADGLWRIADGSREAYAAVTALNAAESADLRADDAGPRALAARSGGGVFWIDDGQPRLRRVASSRRAFGDDWLGLHRRDAAIVAGAIDQPLAPPLLALALCVGLIAACWAREGGRI